MSAYIVSDRTIDAIIYGARTWSRGRTLEGLHPMTNPSEIGQMLLDQNYASVNYRYDEETQAPKYTYPDEGIMGIVIVNHDNEFKLGEVLGCINCYEYQACETPDWYETPIKAWLGRLKGDIAEEALERLGEEIPWGID